LAVSGAIVTEFICKCGLERSENYDYCPKCTKNLLGEARKDGEPSVGLLFAGAFTAIATPLIMLALFLW